MVRLLLKHNFVDVQAIKSASKNLSELEYDSVVRLNSRSGRYVWLFEEFKNFQRRIRNFEFGDNGEMKSQTGINDTNDAFLIS